MINTDFKTVIKNLEIISNKSNINNAINKGLAKVALEIKRKATPFVPRGTGELLNSYEVQTIKGGLEIGFNEVYAMYQHQGRWQDGTHIIRNRPAGGQSYFLKQPIDQNLSSLLDIFEETYFRTLYGL